MFKYCICVLLLIWCNLTTAGEVIKLVVPFAPGTTIDLVAKILQDDLSKRLNRPIVVENKAGAGGAIGSKFVATTDSTDAVLLINSSGLAVNAVFSDSDYNTENLIPMVKIGSAPIILVTSLKSEIYNFQDLLKSNNVTIGNSGQNSLTFLINEIVKKDINKNLIPVPYKGVNQALPDLLSGDLNGAFLFYASALPYIDTKKIIPIAVMSTTRLSELPKVPTFQELNLTALNDVDPWFAIFGNSKINNKDLNVIKLALVNSLRDPKIIKALRDNGINVAKNSNLSRDFLNNEQAKYRKISHELSRSRG